MEEVAEVQLVVMLNKMEMSCPLCKEQVYSDTGIGCEMCGMPLKESDIVFCSESCKEEFKKINK